MKNIEKNEIDLQEKCRDLETKNRKLNELNKQLIRDYQAALRDRNYYRKKARVAYVSL